MKKVILGYALMIGLLSCGNNSAENKSMYDSSASATSGSSAARDSATAQAARDSSAAPKPDTAATTGGGVPAGTIDSGMMNAGAQKKRVKTGHHRHKGK